MSQKKSSVADRRDEARRQADARKSMEKRRSRDFRIAIAAGSLLLATGVTAFGVHLSRSTAVTNDPSMDKSAFLLASTARQSTGDAVDGVVRSDSMEITRHHIHAHLTIYVNGVQKTVPYGIGIVPPYSLQRGPDGATFVSGGKSFYFLHTHDETGIIHAESPSAQSYDLGDFFDVWKQPLTREQVGPAKGTVTIWVNGKKFSGNPRSIKLSEHEGIQLDIGKDMPYRAFTAWPPGY
ncbi:hypothetical protein P1S61_16235 [Streptomyces sp. ME08-AFT2]|uniref:hypothetical protein n=1 Tax=Streptomyces sp. ME08-AFT2 TaxID=3028683 RepID=UPI0029B64B10|nr:hypothetical protein [Streptomyces sp. ME08-AFT2]MDX3310603.1 hypothetical protein [Streptomyces sp. ME08-AFT2]